MAGDTAESKAGVIMSIVNAFFRKILQNNALYKTMAYRYFVLSGFAFNCLI